MPLLSREPSYFSAQVSKARRFYLDLNLNPPARKGLSVISGGWEQCLPEYDLQRPSFYYLIVEFVSGGLGSLTLQGKTCALKPGAVFIYGRGMPHRITASREHGLTKYFVAVAGEEAKRLLQECQILPGSVTQVMDPEQIRRIFDDLVAHGLSDHANRARMCNVAFQYLVMKIADLSVPNGWPSGTASVSTYQRCRQFIEENFLRIHSLKEVAEECHLDSAYLCRLFKRFRRQTPFQYLQNLKMNRAVDLLQSGHRSVKETAQELGFSDPYNFSRTFKRVFGFSPQKLKAGDAG